MSIVEEIRNIVYWNLNCSLSFIRVDALAIMRAFLHGIAIVFSFDFIFGFSIYTLLNPS